MRLSFVAAAVVVTTGAGSFVAAQSAPAVELAGIAKAFLAVNAGNGWENLDKLPAITWAPLPPTDLPNCLPDGGCYTRQGSAAVAGRKLTVMATGARTIVAFVYLRNGSAPFTENGILDALTGVGVSTELARCPVAARAGAGTGGTNWYRLAGVGLEPGVLSIQTSCNGRPCEGLVLSRGHDLPRLQPNQVSLYSEQCASGAPRAPVSARPVVEALADAIIELVPAAAGPPGHDWTSLASLSGDIAWLGDGPKPADMRALGDPNPMMQSGNAVIAGRRFSVRATGATERATTIHLEELGTHPRGEHVLGVLFQKGLAVQLARCGPVYTQSTNNWYRMTSTRTRPVMLRQSIRYDGTLVNEAYELRLDGSLPPRDPRDRDPGVNGCQ